MLPLIQSKYVDIDCSHIQLPRNRYIQIQAGKHTIEILHRIDNSVIVCLNDKSIVKTFKEMYP